MKTTFDIADNILERSRRLSKSERVPLKELVEEGLELVIERRTARQLEVIKAVTFKGNGLSQEFEGASWSKIRDAAYSGHGA